MQVQGRKSFSGPKGGRPRKDGPREPNGQTQRPKGGVRETEAEIISVVLSQPHRRGSTDQRRLTPVGRLILDGRVKAPGQRYAPATLERAAERFAEDYASLRWVMDSRRPFAVTSGARGGRELDEDRKAEIEKRWGDLRRVLRDCGERVQKALEMAILDPHPDFDERTFAQWIVLSLPAGLAALADYYGMEKA